MKTKRKYGCPVARAILRSKLDKASTYIRHAKDEIRPGDKLVLCSRVSHSIQDHTGNLRDQEAGLRKSVEGLRAIVLKVWDHVGSGVNPWWLANAAAIARKQGAKLVAESTDRFIRNPLYHSSKNPNAQARRLELEDLARVTRGLTLATLLHPDASPTQVRSFHRKRGQQAKDRKGGRPKMNKPGYKKERRQRLQPRVVRQYRAGFSFRQISAMTGVPIATAHDWVRRCS